MINSQAILFGIFIINGLLIGIVFDFFRILRRSFKTGIILTSIEDIIFWIIAGFIVMYSIFAFNNGAIRGFMFLGIGLGVAFYMLTLSKFIILVNVKIIEFFKNIILKIFSLIMIPINIIIKVLKKIVLKPITFIFINLKKINYRKKKNSKDLLQNNNS